MPYLLRIQYEDAWYHVINRGANRNLIFKNDEHRYLFLDLLDKVTSLYTAEIHAYCLMDNHYHLLIKTPLANISRIIQYLDGVYTQKFNHDMKRDGALFRGRYKGILIDADSYLVQVSKYIHLNPVKANMVSHPEDFQWSSYRAYIQNKSIPKWLHISEVLGQMNNQHSVSCYKNFVTLNTQNEVSDFYEKKHVNLILGSEEFIDKHLNQSTLLYAVKKKKVSLSIAQIISKISEYYNVDVLNVKYCKPGVFNEARLFALLICRFEFGYALTDIANHFSLKQTRSASSTIIRAQAKVKKTESLQEKYKALRKIIRE